MENRPAHSPRDPAGPDPVNDRPALGSTRILADVAARARHETELLPDDTALPAPQEADPRGETTIGEFRLLKKLGKGAMGAVYKAHQAGFDRIVALKVLFKKVSSNPKLVERMYREGRIMGRLDHPNIVRGYGIGEDGGWHYIAMEYVDGQNLLKWLEGVGRLSVGDALHIIIVCARALQYAHGLEVIHRDVKPDNILVTRDGDIKVADFGMVKMLDEDLSLTQTGHAVGTPWYMPLEQARNAKEADARSDIYALGCTLYCLVTGNPPFTGMTIFEVLKAKEESSFPPARQINPEVPEKLDLIIAKMTAKQVKYRYQTCAELIRDLESLDLVNEDLEFLKQPKSAAGTGVRAGSRALDASMAFADVAEVEPPADDWYVCFKNDAGQIIVSKKTTAEILELIDDPGFDQTATASHKKDEGFRALATYKEFAPILLGRVAKTGCDDRSSRFRNAYKKIEREAELHHPDEPSPSAVATTFDYWFRNFLRLAIPCAVTVGIGFVLYLIGRTIIRALLS